MSEHVRQAQGEQFTQQINLLWPWLTDTERTELQQTSDVSSFSDLLTQMTVKYPQAVGKGRGPALPTGPRRRKSTAGRR